MTIYAATKKASEAMGNCMDMQKGDLPATWANADLLHALTGYKPQTNVRDGIAAIVACYREYYGK